MNTTNYKVSDCQRCGNALQNRKTFSFKVPEAINPAQGDSLPATAEKCFTCALLHRPMLKRSAVAALVVGTILTALNQGDLLISGQWSNAFFWKIPLTYCVPFLVASYGALMNSKR